MQNPLIPRCPDDGDVMRFDERSGRWVCDHEWKKMEMKAKTPVKKPRTLRAVKNTTTLKPSKPKCRLHGTEMSFDPANMRWACDETGCGIVAYPKQDDQGRPITGRGELEVVVYTDEDGLTRTFLRAVDNNVMLDVTPYMKDGFVVEVNADEPESYLVDLVLRRITTLDMFGKKRA